MGRNRPDELEDAMSFVLIGAETLRTLDRLINVRDQTLAPAPDLIAKSAESLKVASSHRAFHSDPSCCAPRVGDGPRVLNHEAALGNRYLEG
jgi:hypothetical protein